MSTTRFSGPVAYSGGGNQTAGGTWFTNLPIQTNPDYVFQYEDFTGIAVDGTNDWTYSQLTSGTGAILADAIGGWYEIAGTGSDNTGASIQGNEIWQPEASKNIFFETRLVTTDADQMDIFVGLCVNATLIPIIRSASLLLMQQQIFTLFVIMGVLKPKPILALILLMVLFPAARLAVIVGWVLLFGGLDKWNFMLIGNWLQRRFQLHLFQLLK
jgi:hypothetical protein